MMLTCAVALGLGAVYAYAAFAVDVWCCCNGMLCMSMLHVVDVGCCCR